MKNSLETRLSALNCNIYAGVLRCLSGLNCNICAGVLRCRSGLYCNIYAAKNRIHMVVCKSEYSRAVKIWDSHRGQKINRGEWHGESQLSHNIYRASDTRICLNHGADHGENNELVASPLSRADSLHTKVCAHEWSKYGAHSRSKEPITVNLNCRTTSIEQADSCIQKCELTSGQNMEHTRGLKGLSQWIWITKPIMERTDNL